MHRRHTHTLGMNTRRHQFRRASSTTEGLTSLTIVGICVIRPHGSVPIIHQGRRRYKGRNRLGISRISRVSWITRWVSWVSLVTRWVSRVSVRTGSIRYIIGVRGTLDTAIGTESRACTIVEETSNHISVGGRFHGNQTAPTIHQSTLGGDTASLTVQGIHPGTRGLVIGFGSTLGHIYKFINYVLYTLYFILYTLYTFFFE